MCCEVFVLLGFMLRTICYAECVSRILTHRVLITHTGCMVAYHAPNTLYRWEEWHITHDVADILLRRICCASVLCCWHLCVVHITPHIQYVGYATPTTYVVCCCCVLHHTLHLCGLADAQHMLRIIRMTRSADRILRSSA